MTWTKFHPSEKKKKTKIEKNVELKNNLLGVKEIEKDIDVGMTTFFSTNCKALVEFLNYDNVSSDDNEIPVAVVSCSFSHVSYFHKSLENKIRRHIDVVKKDTPIKSVIENTKKSKGGVILIEQIESVPNDFIENLLCLTDWFSLPVSFVLCSSTGVHAVADVCSLSTLRRIKPSMFHMPSPEDVFSYVMEIILQQTILKDIFLSCEVLGLLRSRYFCNNFCIDELKKIIRLCTQHRIWMTTKFAQNDKRSFTSNISSYLNNLKFFTKAAKLSLYESHEEIQGGTFKAERFQMNTTIITQWMQENFVDDSIREKMQAALLECERMKNTPIIEPNTIQTPKQTKMKAVEFRKAAEVRRIAAAEQKQLAPESILKHAFSEMFHSLLPQWTTFPQSEVFLVTIEPYTAFYCDPGAVVESALLKEETKNEPLSLTYRTLQTRPNWKNIKISDWRKQYDTQSQEVADLLSFYASLGQLESMGVIRATNEKTKDIINVIRHPINSVLN